MVTSCVSGTCLSKCCRVKCALGTICSVSVEEDSRKCVFLVAFSLCWLLIFGTVFPEEGKVKERERLINKRIKEF